MTIEETQKILRAVKAQAAAIERGDEARRRRDDLYLRGRDVGISIADLARSAGVSPNAVKFSLAARRRRGA